MDDKIDKFNSWKNVLDEESGKADKEIYERFLKCHLDVLSVKELFRIVGKEAIIAWINQFEDEEDQDTAFSIFKKIKYYNSIDMIHLCQLNFSDWIVDSDASVQTSLFVPLGGVGKSGSMVGYLFRMANSIPKEAFCGLDEIKQRKFVFDERITDIVLLDDYAGTGDQFANDEILQSLFCHSRGKIRVSFLPVVISMQAKKRIQDAVGINIYCHQIRSERSYSHSEKALIKRYGKGLFMHHEEDLRFGWGGLAETIVFFYNVPNNSLPIIWSSSYSRETQRNWVPLFSRVNPNGDNEIEQLIMNFIQLPSLVSEDFTLYIRVFTEAFVLLRDKKITFSFQELYKLYYCITQIMYPYSLFVDYHSPFLSFQNLRIKMLRLVKDSMLSSETKTSDLLEFYTVDYPVVDQGCLIRSKYSEILAEYVISRSLDLSEFVDIVDRDMDDSKRLVYVIEGFIQLAEIVIKERRISEREKDLFKHLRFQGKSETIRFWIANSIYKEKNRDDIDENNVYILVNCYGKYEVWSLKNARRYNLV